MLRRLRQPLEDAFLLYARARRVTQAAIVQSSARASVSGRVGFTYLGADTSTGTFHGISKCLNGVASYTFCWHRQGSIFGPGNLKLGRRISAEKAFCIQFRMRDETGG
ncbi:hypothetical protein ACGC1H_003986 [Rhizoctonia solani]